MESIKDPKAIREDTIGRTVIRLVYGNITKVSGGVLMNPTNYALSRNSGVSIYLINSAGSGAMLEMSSWKREKNRLKSGEIAVTSAGNLPATFICHTCIPQYSKDDADLLVRMFIIRVLEKAEDLNLHSVIIPCLPPDAYGFTPEECALGYYSSIIDYLNLHENTILTEIKYVAIDNYSSRVFEREADRRFGTKKSIFSFITRR